MVVGNSYHVVVNGCNFMCKKKTGCIFGVVLAFLHVPYVYAAPVEATLVSNARPEPSPSSKDYVTITESVNDMGEEGILFNGSKRVSLRDVEISGREVILDNVGLAEPYLGNADLLSLTVYAERVVVRSPVRFPQTNVTIYAKTLVFEDRPEADNSYIDTSPLSYTVLPQNASESLDVGESGKPGLKAGDITLYVATIVSGGEHTRFKMRGGDGQKAGKGWTPPAKNDLLTLCSSEIHQPNELRIVQQYAAIDPCAVTYFAVPFRTKFYSGIAREYLYISNVLLAQKNRRPDDGRPAKPPGVPGDSGSGGNLYYLNQVESAWVDQTAGAPGNPAHASDYISGGKPGSPAKSYQVATCYFRPRPPFSGISRGMLAESTGESNLAHWDIDVLKEQGCRWLEGMTPAEHAKYPGFRISEFESKSGQNAIVPRAEISDGGAGITDRIVASSYAWLHPYALRSIVEHVKDIYLSGNLDLSDRTLEEYITVLQSYEEQPTEQAADFSQLLVEMAAMRVQIANNLDYYGNPGGWVPLSSFEKTTEAFRNEVTASIDILYSTYWMEDSMRRSQQQVHVLRDQKTNLMSQIRTSEKELKELNETIPSIESEVKDLERQIKLFSVAVEERKRVIEEKVRRQQVSARRANRWRGDLKMIGAICKVIPVYQPALAAVGTALETVADIDSSKPEQGMAQLQKAWEDIDRARLETDSAVSVEMQEKFSCSDQEKLQKCLGDWKSIANSFGPALKALQESQSSYRVDENQLKSEVERIKKQDDFLGDLVTKAYRIAQARKLLVDRIAQLSLVYAQKMVSINANLIFLDAINRKLSKQSNAIDHRASQYIRSIANRAVDRLNEYEYIFSKAYEYRVLEPYPAETGSSRLMERLAKYLKEKLEDPDGQEASETISENDYKKVSVIYADIFQRINKSLLDKLEDVRVTEKKSLTLTQDELDDLNESDGMLVVNLKKRGSMFFNEENVRIHDIQVNALEVAYLDEEGLYPEKNIKITISHGGESVFRSNLNYHVFRHRKQDELEIFQWGATHNGRDIIDPLEPITQTLAVGSMLKGLLGIDEDASSNGHRSDLSYYVKPGAIGDLVIRKTSARDTGPTRVTKLNLDVWYQYNPAQTVEIYARTSPCIGDFRLDKQDIAGRGNGRGQLLRLYKPGEKIRIEAAATCNGNLKFREWRAVESNGARSRHFARSLEVDIHRKNDVALEAVYSQND